MLQDKYYVKVLDHGSYVSVILEPKNPILRWVGRGLIVMEDWLQTFSNKLFKISK